MTSTHPSGQILQLITTLLDIEIWKMRAERGDAGIQMGGSKNYFKV
jgi:hypothetical protein